MSFYGRHYCLYLALQPDTPYHSLCAVTALATLLPAHPLWGFMPSIVLFMRGVHQAQRRFSVMGRLFLVEVVFSLR